MADTVTDTGDFSVSDLGYSVFEIFLDRIVVLKKEGSGYWILGHHNRFTDDQLLSSTLHHRFGSVKPN
jgi:hypothetical protein